MEKNRDTKLSAAHDPEKPRSAKSPAAFLFLLFVISGICLAISMAAPGNQKRADAVGGLSAVSAIGEAFRQAVILIRQYTGLLQILFALCLILFFLFSSGSRRMRHPIGGMLLGSLLLFLLFVSGLVPRSMAWETSVPADSRTFIITPICYFCRQNAAWW